MINGQVMLHRPSTTVHYLDQVVRVIHVKGKIAKVVSLDNNEEFVVKTSTLYASAGPINLKDSFEKKKITRDNLRRAAKRSA